MRHGRRKTPIQFALAGRANTVRPQSILDAFRHKIQVKRAAGGQLRSPVATHYPPPHASPSSDRPSRGRQLRSPREYTPRKSLALPRWSQYFQPAAAGLLIGIIAVVGAPQVMGAGYEYIDQAMHGQFTWEFLAILAGLKIVATLLSFVSGTPGGMFAPTLFIGAMLGAAVGGAEHVLLPHLTGSPGTYALVGMGVLFAGFLRAPMTSVWSSGGHALKVNCAMPKSCVCCALRKPGMSAPAVESSRDTTWGFRAGTWRSRRPPIRAPAPDPIGKRRAEVRIFLR